MNLKWSLLIGAMLIPASLFANTLYFPQVAFGGGFSTSLVIINTGSIDVSSKVDFYGQSGANLAALTMPVNIKAGAIARFTIPDAGPLTEVWGELAAGEGTLQGSATFDLRTTNGRQTTACVFAIEANNSFVFPVEFTSSSTTGIAIANTSTSSLNVRVRMNTEGGTEEIATTVTLPPHGQSAKFVEEIFSLSTASLRGTLSVDAPASSGNALAVTALTVKEGILSALPVLTSSGGISEMLYFPQVVLGGHFSTNFVLFNGGTTPITSVVNFYDQRGNFHAEYTEPVVLQPGASKRFTRQSAGDLITLWGELVAGSGVQGVASFDLRDNNGTLVTTATVLGLRSGSSFFMPVDMTDKSSTGVAIANVSNSINAAVRLHLLDEDGAEVAMSSDTSFSPLNAHAQVADFVETFFPQLNGTTFRGALVVEALGRPIVATALTVKDGLISALPVLPGSIGHFKD